MATFAGAGSTTNLPDSPPPYSPPPNSPTAIQDEVILSKNNVGAPPQPRPQPPSTRLSSHGCVVSKCCCGCCTLRTGSIIIAWLSLIVVSVWIVWIAELANIASESSYFARSNPGLLMLVTITLALQCLHLVVSILLIIGIGMKKVFLIEQYVYLTATILMIHIIGSIIMLITYGANKSDQSWDSSQVVPMVTNIALQIYFITVVRSYAITVKEEKIRPQPTVREIEII